MMVEKFLNVNRISERDSLPKSDPWKGIYNLKEVEAKIRSVGRFSEKVCIIQD